jgi:hypothetical protein
MNERKGISEMAGEALRETAVLVVVFVPLDVLVSNLRFNWQWGVATFAISARLFALGVWFERQRANFP